MDIKRDDRPREPEGRDAKEAGADQASLFENKNSQATESTQIDFRLNPILMSEERVVSGEKEEFKYEKERPSNVIVQKRFDSFTVKGN